MQSLRAEIEGRSMPRVVAQYDACKGASVLPMKGYILVGVATVITAASSVWNQKIVKGFTVCLSAWAPLVTLAGTHLHAAHSHRLPYGACPGASQLTEHHPLCVRLHHCCHLVC